MLSPLYLHAPALGDLTPALTLGQGYPEHIEIVSGGQAKKVPCAYFWKDVIAVGKYVHPATKQELSVDAKRIDGWVEKFNRMRAAGVEFPTPADHSSGAKDNLGFVLDAKRNGDRLSLLHQAIGEDAAMIAVRNRASLCIEPEYHDEKGNKWEDVFTHSAYTPNPVITGMGSFVPFAASRGPQTETPIYYLSAEERNPMNLDFKALREALGAAADIPDEKLPDLAATRITTLGTDGKAALARATAAEKERDTLKDQNIELSRKVEGGKPDKPRASELMWLGRTLVAARKEAVESGAVTPAIADKAEQRYMSKPIELGKLTLSRAVEDDDHRIVNDGARLLDFYETVKGNVPAPKPGENTLLNRQTPGGDGDDEKAEAAAKAGREQAERYESQQRMSRGIAK